MPQVQKAANQIALENRISKAKQLLRHLQSSLKSMRARNKAERERNRREAKMNSLDTNIQAAYDGLRADAPVEVENGGVNGDDDGDLGDDADIEDDGSGFRLEGGKSSSSNTSKKRRIYCNEGSTQ